CDTQGKNAIAQHRKAKATSLAPSSQAAPISRPCGVTSQTNAKPRVPAARAIHHTCAAHREGAASPGSAESGRNGDNGDCGVSPRAVMKLGISRPTSPSKGSDLEGSAGSGLCGGAPVHGVRNPHISHRHRTLSILLHVRNAFCGSLLTFPAAVA